MPGKITENGAILVEIDGGGSTAPSEVEVTNFPASQAVTVAALGTAGSTQQGSTTNAAYTDVTGAANGTMIALLKGIFMQLAIIADNTTPTP